jgi:hypothetical protein
MAEILARAWADLVARIDGPLHLRLIIQPCVAAVLAIRAGLRDARDHEPPFLYALLADPEHRRERLRRAWRDIRNLFLVSAALDVVYQLVVHAAVYAGELLLTAALLALVPYALVREAVTRLARKRVSRASQAR